MSLEVESFARIIESTIRDSHVASGENTERPLFDVAWKTVCRLLTRLRTAEPAKTSYPKTVVGFLVAVMVLRQALEAEAHGDAARNTDFLPFSTNVHPAFLPCLLDKVGSTLIDLSKPVRLSDLSSRIDAWSREGRADNHG